MEKKKIKKWVMKKNFIKATESYSTLDSFVAAPMLRKSFEINEPLNAPKLLRSLPSFHKR